MRVTSPTPNSGRPHKDRDIALALSHNQGGGDLPRVIASGQAAIARQTLEIPLDRGIKVRKDANLAEVLAAVEFDCEIPLAAFAAVAEILSCVYHNQSGAAVPPPAETDTGAAP
jgi:flagellar biosynthesis protein